MPASCPECGGNTRFDPNLKRIICESCGLALTRGELEEIRSKTRRAMDYYDEDRKNQKKRDKKRSRHKDYLEWWTSEHNEE